MSFPTKLAFSLAAFFILVSVWVMAAPLFPSGISDRSGNLVFYNKVIFHDSLDHISIERQLLYSFPPGNFAMAGLGVIKNYHYIYDIFVAFAAKVTGISVFDLYYRVFPVIVGLIFCLSVYFSGRRLFKNPVFAALGIFFTVFSTSLGFILPFIKTLTGGNHAIGADNSFMFDQITGMMVNPHGVLSLTFYLLIFICIEKYLSGRKAVYLVIYALLLGISFGLKAYGGVVFAVGAVCFALYSAFVRKDFLPLIFTLTGGILMFLWVRFTLDPKAAGLSFNPLWLTDKMFADLDRINEPGVLNIKYAGGRLGMLRLTGISLIEILVFIVGGLGIRVFGIFELIKRIKKPDLISPGFVFMTAAAGASLAFPLLFNQGKKAYDIVQFLPYFLVYSSLMFTAAFESFIEKTKHSYFKIPIPVALIAILFYLNLNQIAYAVNPTNEPVIIPAETVRATDYISKNTPRESVFLLTPDNFNYSYAWFSGLTGRRTVLSDERFAFQVGGDTDKLKNEIGEYFSGNSVPGLQYDYFYLPKAEQGEFDKIEGKYHLIRVFETGDSLILKKTGKNL